MQYKRIKIKEQTWFLPNPSNWEELRETLHDGVRFSPIDPNNVERDDELFKTFLQ